MPHQPQYRLAKYLATSSMNVAHLFSRQIFIFQALNFWVHVAMLKVDMFAIRHLLQTTLELQS